MSKTLALRHPAPRKIPSQLAARVLGPDDLIDDARWTRSALSRPPSEEPQPGPARARGVGFDQCRLAKIGLAGSRLPNLKCSDVEFEQANLANLELLNATLFRSAFLQGKLSGLRLTESFCHDCEFRDCRMDYSVFHGVKFKQVLFQGCDLSEVEFHDCQFESVQWVDCRLDRASFLQVRFAFGEFRHCSMEGLRGFGHLRGAAMERGDILAAAEGLASELGIKALD